MKNKVKILAMDGGTHGFTWLLCLREIEENNPGFLAETDVFTGSSFGGFCALYFGRHMGSLRPGQSALDIIDGCLAFMQELLDFDPDEAAYARFMGGLESMYSHERMEKVLTDPKHLGDACLGDMHRRVIISASGTKNPSRGPKIYDSTDEKDRKVRASEIGLESAALPIMLPLRNGLTNGSLGGTNGSMIGLTRVVGGESKVSLDDVVLLSLGGDPETSSLANFSTPWDETDAVPKKLSLDSVIRPTAEDAEAFAMLNQKVDALWKSLETSLKVSSDPKYTKPRLGFELLRKKGEATSAEKASTEQSSTEKGSTSWGWRHWLTHAASPLFYYQVITSTEAVEVSEQASLLLGKRALRVAPMALLNYGQILFMTFLSKPAESEVIVKVAELTAALWGDSETSEKFKFSPTIDETEAFIDAYWMPRERKGRPQGQRRSGWRRGKLEWTAAKKLGPLMAKR